MGIEADYSINQVNDFLRSIPSIMKEELIRALSYLGEQCVRRVRDRSGKESWFDQTGNLRSSIGYAVYEEGKTVIESAFNQVGQGSHGGTSGRKLVAELASKYAETYAMVVVAGMEYAAYVEAMNNKDVLASTELWAKGEVDRYINQALSRAANRISQLQHKLGL